MGASPMATTSARRQAFVRDGWILVPRVVASERCDDVRRELVTIFERTGAGRLLNAWEVSDAVRALATDPAVLGVVEDLLGSEVVAFQTLDFRLGTQQEPHADSLFFDTLPRGRMCGAWVALEDVGPDAGPLRVWPGSHVAPALWGADLAPGPGHCITPAEACAVALGALPLHRDVTAAKGDVVVWAANLLHGGAPIRDGHATRWSQVTHYVARGHLTISPLTSDVASDRYMVRDQLTDVATGRRVPLRAGADRVVLAHGRGGLSRIHVAPGPGRVASLRVRDLLRGAPSTRRWLAPRSRRALRRLRGTPVST